MASESERVPRIEQIGITADQFRFLEERTRRWGGDAKAIFSTNDVNDIFPSTRHGKVPLSERLDVSSQSLILDKLAECLRRWRVNGGRIFVTERGAYWKERRGSETVKMQFARWEWKGDPPSARTAEQSARMVAEFSAMFEAIQQRSKK